MSLNINSDYMKRDKKKSSTPNREDDDILNYIKSNTDNIDNIENPSKLLIFTALINNGLSIKYIKNPTRDMEEVAILQNKNASEFITERQDMSLSNIKKLIDKEYKSGKVFYNIILLFIALVIIVNTISK